MDAAYGRGNGYGSDVNINVAPGLGRGPGAGPGADVEVGVAALAAAAAAEGVGVGGTFGGGSALGGLKTSAIVELLKNSFAYFDVPGLREIPIACLLA